MKKAIRISALEQAKSLTNHNNPMVRLTHERQRKAVRMLYLDELIAELTQERDAIRKELQETTKTEGLLISENGKSDYFAVSFRKDYELKYLVYREGEQQTVVDYTAYAKAMGETADSLKAKGYCKTRKGTSTFGLPNKQQEEFLLQVFAE